jgi:hypothetical protein
LLKPHVESPCASKKANEREAFHSIFLLQAMFSIVYCIGYADPQIFSSRTP